MGLPTYNPDLAGADLSRRSDMSTLDMPTPGDEACEENMAVSDGACVPCPQGTTRKAGDRPKEGDTSCVPTMCERNFSVQDHRCVRCPPGFARPGGDDATKEDTLCQGTGHQTLAAGFLHTCALTHQGQVMCWGNNAYGQLGDGTQVSSSTPGRVKGLTDVVEIVAGSAHTCALTQEGDVFCWGFNKDQELGTKTSLPFHLQPLKIRSLPAPIVSLSSSTYHSCALSKGGKAYCWGANLQGQIQSSAWVEDTLPKEMTTFSQPVIQIKAGRWHTCALLEDGGVECMGGNRYGELGAETRAPTHNVGVKVPFGEMKVKEIKLGHGFGCALGGGGEVRCWGGNTVGQLGDGTYDYHYEPAPPGRTAPRSASAFGVGAEHACMNTDRGLQCWGNNFDGRVGVNSDMNEPLPKDSAYKAQHVYAMALGHGHTCVWGSVDGLQCWGSDTSGQLGSGKTPFLHKKIPLELPKDVTRIDISDAGNHACALTKEGEVLCWGANFNGQLGDGTTERRTKPVAVKDLGGKAIDVAAGFRRSCAVLEGGRVKCWGLWPLGNGTTGSSLLPTTVNLGPVGVVSVHAGLFHACVMTKDNAVYCWGHNYRGQVGLYDNQWASSPVQVEVFPGALKLDVAGQRSCVTRDNGRLECWGENAYHFGGRHYNDYSPNEYDMGGLIAEVSLSQNHACAILRSGEVKCSGFNSAGQVGALPVEEVLTVRQVEALGQKSEVISSGFEHSCAVIDQGTVHCWGGNAFQLLSDRVDLPHDHIPHRVSGFPSSPRALFSGGHTTCALLSGGQTMCWGSGQWGLLGDRFTQNTHLPVSVTLEP